MGEIILGDVSVKAGFEPGFCGSPEMVARLAVDDDIDEVVVVVVDVVAIAVGKIVGSLSIVVADVTAVAVAVAVVAIEEGNDECNVAFLTVYGSVALPVIGLETAVVAVIAEAFLMGVIGVVFFPLTGSSGRPPFDDDAGTADAVISSAKKTQHWMVRILDSRYYGNKLLPLTYFPFPSESNPSYRKS